MMSMGWERKAGWLMKRGSGARESGKIKGGEIFKREGGGSGNEGVLCCAALAGAALLLLLLVDGVGGGEGVWSGTGV